MAHMTMKLFQINKYQLLLFCGFLILSYIFYIRVFLKRLPRELTCELPYTIKIIFFYLLLLFVYLFITNCYKYLTYNNYYIPKNAVNFDIILKNPVFYKILNILNFWSNSLYTVHFYLIENFPSMLIIFKSLGNFIYEKIPFKHLNYLNLFFILLPKTIVLISFMIDIFYYHILHYFYKSSILLLIPLIFNYLRFAIEESYLESIREFNKIVIIKDKDTQKSILAETYTLQYCKNPAFDLEKYTYSFTDGFKEKYKESNIDYDATLEDFMIDFNVCVQIIKFMTIGIQIQQLFHGPKYHLILYFFYIISWAFVLYLIT